MSASRIIFARSCSRGRTTSSRKPAQRFSSFRMTIRISPISWIGPLRKPNVPSSCARDRARKLIVKIDAALRRIKDGTYGYCEETGEPISIKRLEARPIATLSVEAQGRRERFDRFYRDE